MRFLKIFGILFVLAGIYFLVMAWSDYSQLEIVQENEIGRGVTEEGLSLTEVYGQTKNMARSNFFLGLPLFILGIIIWLLGYKKGKKRYEIQDHVGNQ